MKDFVYFKHMQLSPPYLKKGDMVGIAAPARWVDHGDTETFVAALESEGYRVFTGAIHNRYHQFAGDDATRLSDLQSMFDDPDLHAVFCARGGYGSARLLDRIGLSGFAGNPKWLVGFSDITALHSLLYTRLGCESLHAAMPYTMKYPDNGQEAVHEPGIRSLFDTLQGKLSAYTVEPHALNRSGKAEGVLLGGNLSVLYSLTGTPFQPDTQDAILFLEDTDEYLYHIDRMMLNLKQAGMLSGLRGLVVGGMTEMHDNEVPFGPDANRIILDAVREYSYPVLFDFPAGHRQPNMPLILGRCHQLAVEGSGEGILSANL